MSCCGRARAAARGLPPAGAAGISGASRIPRTHASPGATFEYVGVSALTTIGLVTRKRYVFHAPGVRQYADPRDVHGLRMIPLLREAPQG
jgi:hypothetical protein